MLDRLDGSVPADTLLDRHTCPDHNRSVFTLLGEEAPRRLARAAVALLDLGDHEGAHPRLGVVDVVPFVALDGSTATEALAARDRFARWAADELALPCFLYGPRADAPRGPRRCVRDVRTRHRAAAAPSDRRGRGGRGSPAAGGLQPVAGRCRPRHGETDRPGGAQPRRAGPRPGRGRPRPGVDEPDRPDAGRPGAGVGRRGRRGPDRAGRAGRPGAGGGAQRHARGATGRSSGSHPRRRSRPVDGCGGQRPTTGRHPTTTRPEPWRGDEAVQAVADAASLAAARASAR